MKQHVMGVDFGSTTAKTVILDLKGNIVSHSVAHMGAVSGNGVKQSMKDALEQAGLSQADIGRTVSTGYGRRMLDEADKNYTEITCHARGAVAMVPGARLVIDIGGQDSKVISVDSNGLVSQFAMNDRCAAGTGKFLEVLARAMEIELAAMGGIALEATQKLKISSMCATFAETEVISLLAEGHGKPDVLGAVHKAIAMRTLGLVGRVGKKGPVVMTGGVAKNPAAVHHIQEELQMPLILPEFPQIAGALARRSSASTTIGQRTSICSSPSSRTWPARSRWPPTRPASPDAGACPNWRSTRRRNSPSRAGSNPLSARCKVTSDPSLPMDRFPALRLILKLGRVGAGFMGLALTGLFLWLAWGGLGWWALSLSPFVLATSYFLFKSYVEIVQIITEMVH